MWSEQFKDKEGKTKYRFYEKYKDPYTNKWRRVSIVMNKDTKASQKEGMFQLDEKIKNKLNTKSNFDNDITFHNLLDEYFKDYKITSGTKESTAYQLELAIKRVKQHSDKNLLAKNIDLNIVQNIIDSLQENKSLTDKYVKTVTFPIKKALFYGFERMDLPQPHYLQFLRLPKTPKTREQLKKQRENFLELNQAEALIAYFKRKAKETNKEKTARVNYITACVVEFMFFCGTRIGETLAIQNDNIDFENKTVEIDGTMKWKEVSNGFGIKDTTKTEKSYRVIALPTRIVKMLYSLQLENKKYTSWGSYYNDREYLFTNTHGNPLFDSVINAKLKDGCKACEINKRVTTHTLRHSNISLLAQLGISLKAIMNRVGHSDYKTTLQIYSHVTDQMDKELINKLENISG